MREMFDGVGVSIAANTALFTGLDFGQWIADTLSLSNLPANLIAAVIATSFGLGLTALIHEVKRYRHAMLAALPGPAPAAVLMPVTFRRSLPVYPRAVRR